MHISVISSRSFFIKKRILPISFPPQTLFNFNQKNKFWSPHSTIIQFSSEPNSKSNTGPFSGIYARFKEKKAEYIVQYGSSFILVHEVLGITSYIIVFGFLYSGIIPLASLADYFGWTEADLEKYHINLNSKLVTFAMTYPVVKSLDLMGLVPIRWALTILITPTVARYIGPTVDKIFAKFRLKFQRKL